MRALPYLALLAPAFSQNPQRAIAPDPADLLLCVAFCDEALGKLLELRRILEIIGRISKSIKVGPNAHMLDAGHIDAVVDRSCDQVQARLVSWGISQQFIKMTPTTPPVSAILRSSQSLRL